MLHVTIRQTTAAGSHDASSHGPGQRGDHPTLPSGFTRQQIVTGLPAWDLVNFAFLPDGPTATCTDSHTVGTVIAAQDGSLYLGNGDASS